MVYICVICMATQVRLWTVNNEQRQLLAAILSPAVRPKDWDRLKTTLLLACSDCTKQVQSVVGFQGTALAGVTHLLSLLPSVETEQDAGCSQEKEKSPDPLSLLKDESLEDSLLEINSYIEMQPELETKPLTQVDVKLESASEPGAAAADSRTAAVEPKREDNTSVGETTISVSTDQNTQDSSTQATPVTRCDTRIATFTHGPMRVTPRGNVVYSSMLPGNPAHGVSPPGNVVCGSMLPGNPGHGVVPSGNVVYGSMLPGNPGHGVVPSGNVVYDSMLPGNPGHSVVPSGNVVYGSMLPGNPGQGVVPSGNFVYGSMLPGNPGHGVVPSGNVYGSMLPGNPGHGVVPSGNVYGSMLPGNPGHGVVPSGNVYGSMLPGNPGHGVVPSGNVVYGSMLPGNPGHGVVPSGNVVYGSMLPGNPSGNNVCGSTPTSYVQNYQMNHVTSPMLPRLVPRTHPANKARVTSLPYLFNAAGQNMPINQLNPNLATLANRNGVKLPRREQVTAVTSEPGGSIFMDVDAGNEQTDKQEITQPKSGPWYVQFLSEAEILAEREAARSAPEFAEAPHKCDACLVVFDSYDDKDAHDSSVHMCSAGGYSCGICGYSVDNPNELRAHASRHSTRFCCSHCQFRTPDESVIRRHYCTNMPSHRKPKDRRKRNRRPAGDHKCPECAGRFQQEAQLQAHIERLHANPSGPVTCEVCKKSFRNKYKYNVHMYRHKKQEERERGVPPRPDLFCKECVKEFESKAAYENHMNTLKHSSKENWKFECDICKAKFSSKSGVRVHIMRIHLKPQRYKCDQCPKDYSSKVSMRRHKLSHAPADARAAADRRPHVCHLCAKAFTIPKSLREHLLMHEGLRPHACPLCPATFTYSAALYTHNRLKHLKIKRNIKKKPNNKKTKKKAEKSTELPTD